MNERITIDRELKITLLNWLKRGYIDGAEVKEIAKRTNGGKTLSVDEAREYLRKLEEDY